MDRLLTILLVGGGGFLGANARYWLNQWIIATWPGIFPSGTLCINVSGSLILGFLGTLVAEKWFTSHENVRLLWNVGFLGGYTTFSTFSLDTINLFTARGVGPAALYVALSVTLSILAAVLGVWGARHVIGS